MPNTKSSTGAWSADAILSLARWQNALIAAAGVYIGAWWAGGWRTPAVLLAALAAVALTAAANAWNDIADVEIDRRAHPARPLPAGALAAGTARAIAWGAALAGVVLASAARVELGALSVLVLALMRAYSPRLKQLGLAGNVTVAVLASLPFLYGAWAAGNAGAALPLLTVAAPLHFAREIAKDLDDAPADHGLRRTVPIASGRRAALGAMLAALALWLVALLPLALPRTRLGLLMLPAIVIALAAIRTSLHARPGAPSLLKAAMLLSMLALVAAYA